ncbi:MAG: hypothetical protein WD669_08605 [Pirellulales bacterium]
MNYQVVLMPAADRDLTQLWLGSRLRHKIASALEQIDAELQSDPAICGESRAGDMRIMLVAPVGVLFRIDESQRIVAIHAV